jgi:hypothetical protein
MSLYNYFMILMMPVKFPFDAEERRVNDILPNSMRLLASAGPAMAGPI